MQGVARYSVEWFGLAVESGCCPVLCGLFRSVQERTGTAGEDRQCGGRMGVQGGYRPGTVMYGMAGEIRQGDVGRGSARRGEAWQARLGTEGYG